MNFVIVEQLHDGDVIAVYSGGKTEEETERTANVMRSMSTHTFTVQLVLDFELERALGELGA